MTYKIDLTKKLPRARTNSLEHFCRKYKFKIGKPDYLLKVSENHYIWKYQNDQEIIYAHGDYENGYLFKLCIYESEQQLWTN